MLKTKTKRQQVERTRTMHGKLNLLLDRFLEETASFENENTRTLVVSPSAQERVMTQSVINLLDEFHDPLTPMQVSLASRLQHINQTFTPTSQLSKAGGLDEKKLEGLYLAEGFHTNFLHMSNKEEEQRKKNEYMESMQVGKISFIPGTQYFPPY